MLVLLFLGSFAYIDVPNSMILIFFSLSATSRQHVCVSLSFPVVSFPKSHCEMVIYVNGLLPPGSFYPSWSDERLAAKFSGRLDELKFIKDRHRERP